MNNKQFRQQVAMAQRQLKLEQAKRMNLSVDVTKRKKGKKSSTAIMPQVLLMGISHLCFK